mmetsp:Transcript_81051/g.147908  ORF Transcript_81051/g.147908 Transcript_81051/m.147908 type:complete len:299 (-) Transcript_81051:101-997(-)
MSLAKFAMLAVCCKVGHLCLASVVSEDAGECAALPAEQASAGERAMLQHSEAHRVGINAVEGSSKAKKAPQCTCQTANPEWKPCKRTVAKCVFIDLGAADGNTFKVFLEDGYGAVSNCTENGPGAWEAILVEANPNFNDKLKAEAAKYPFGYVHAMTSTAAYMCEGQTSFFVDTVNTAQNFWGSSMSANTPDVQKSGKTSVTVPTLNVNRILYENTIPADRVILKMDIEGAEFDVLPCLVQSPSSNLVDSFYLEEHPVDWGNIGTTLADMEVHKATLVSRGIEIPQYFSHTLLQKGSA